ncbi:MAG: hypothetical protein GY699_09445 [Desulfobacteraceae bacterium]|nr:hypothetical protein [Desulfobacteraceae bacterium]
MNKQLKEYLKKRNGGRDVQYSENTKALLQAVFDLGFNSKPVKFNPPQIGCHEHVETFQDNETIFTQLMNINKEGNLTKGI